MFIFLTTALYTTGNILDPKTFLFKLNAIWVVADMPMESSIIQKAVLRSETVFLHAQNALLAFMKTNSQ